MHNHDAPYFLIKLDSILDNIGLQAMKINKLGKSRRVYDTKFVPTVSQIVDECFWHTTIRERVFGSIRTPVLIRGDVLGRFVCRYWKNGVRETRELGFGMRTHIVRLFRYSSLKLEYPRVVNFIMNHIPELKRSEEQHGWHR